jgi:hypothetical protein
MKFFKDRLSIIFLLLSINLAVAQLPSNDSLGIDDKPYLNSKEIEFLEKSLLSSQRDTVKLGGKKLGFITGSSGNIVLAKSAFLKKQISYLRNNNSNRPIVYISFDQKSKEASGGYDGLISHVSKMYQKNKIIRKLRSNDFKKTKASVSD